MGKIDQAAEKRDKNGAYADKHRKTVTVEEIAARKELRQRGGRAANWCRIKGHPLSCNCIYVYV